MSWQNSFIIDIVLEGKGNLVSGPFGSNISRKFFVEKGIPVIRGNNLPKDNSKFYDDGFVFITEEKAYELRNCIALSDDILFTSAGTVGDVGIIPTNVKFEKYIISNKQIRLRVNTKIVIPIFVYFWLKQTHIKKTIENLNTGSSIPLLTLGSVKKIPISFPNLKTQKSIADIISTYDDLIENNLKRIKLVEQAAQNIYKEWFVNMRFPDHENSPIDQETGLPEGWKEKELSNLVSFLGGFAFKSKTYVNNGRFRVITIKNVGDKIFNTSVGNFVDEIPPKLKEHCFISEGDILLSLTGNVGRSCIAFGENNLLNQRVAKIKAVNNNWSPYIYWMFNDIKLFSLMNNLATGSAQQNLSPIKLAKQNVIIPDELIIDSYCEKVNSFFNQIILLNKSIIKLKSARDILLPRLMNQTIEV